jgi:hypothetical protein
VFFPFFRRLLFRVVRVFRGPLYSVAAEGRTGFIGVYLWLNPFHKRQEDYGQEDSLSLHS